MTENQRIGSDGRVGENDLSVACVNNNEKLARSLIKKGADVNFRDIYEKTPLMFACENDHQEIVKLLVDSGADLLLKNKKKETCLYHAYARKNNELVEYLIEKEPRLINEDKEFFFKVVEQNDVQTMKYLIEQKINLDVQERNHKKTALKRAFERGNFEIAKVLIEHGANLNLIDEKGNTALIFAIRSYKQNLANRIVKMLIENNANVNLQNKKGKTALMFACENNHQEIVKLLVDSGADLLLKNKRNETCLYHAYARKNNELVKYLIEKEPRLINEDKEFFFEVVKQNDFQMVKYLVERGIDLNLTDKEGNTALMFALDKIAKILIEHGANLNLVDKYRNTVLMIAVCYCPEIVNQIISKNVSVNSQNNEGKTALMIAFQRENFKMAQVLMDHEANLNLADKEGNTALMFAVRSEQINFVIPVVKMMIEKNADLNLQNKRKETALIIALHKQNHEVSKDSCMDEKFELIRLLIKNGANLNVQDSEGKTPLMISLERQYFLISEIFIDNNCKLDLLDKNRESVWFYLCKFNSVKFKERQRNTNKNDKSVKAQMVEAHKRCLEKLVLKSSLINKENKRGQIPLFKAIESNSDQWIIELLIKKGADLSNKNKEGKTALYCAIKNNRIRVVELLIKNGADLNEQTSSEPYLYLACTNNNSALCKLLIEKGINLHCQYMGIRVFNVLIKRQTFIQSKNFIIYRNALIKELSATFNYSDYEEFKHKVVESIDNEDIILVDSDHLEAFSLYPKDEKELLNVTGYLESLEFKERLIVDYLNVLGDQKELLKIRKNKLSVHFPDLSQSFKQQQLKSIPKFGRPTQREKVVNLYFKIKELFSEETFQNLIDLIESQENEQLKLKIFKEVIESICKYIEMIKFKTSIGNKLLELVEKK